MLNGYVGPRRMQGLRRPHGTFEMHHCRPKQPNTHRARPGLSAGARTVGASGCIGDVRARDLLEGLEVVEDRKTPAPAEALGGQLADRMMELGLSANIAQIPGKGVCMRIALPLTISEEDLQEGLRIIGKRLGSPRTRCR